MFTNICQIPSESNLKIDVLPDIQEHILLQQTWLYLFYQDNQHNWLVQHLFVQKMFDMVLI
jgi:hypothetical protein